MATVWVSSSDSRGSDGAISGRESRRSASFRRSSGPRSASRKRVDSFASATVAAISLEYARAETASESSVMYVA